MVFEQSLPGGLVVASLNESETEFLYAEIFEQVVYGSFGYRHTPLVIDVGANIGLFSIWVLTKNSRARVIAFEPVTEAFEAYRLNVLPWRDRVVAHRISLGAHSGTASICFYPRMPANSTYHPSEKAQQQKDFAAVAPMQARLHYEYELRSSLVRRLDSYLLEDRVDLVKIDVEGHELEVLKGISSRGFRKIDRFAIEVQDHGNRLRKVLALLDRQRYVSDIRQSAAGARLGLFTVLAQKRRTRN